MENKRVIIVGPSSHLDGLKMGSFIDSFDVVVKCNHSFYLKNFEDYGKRCDILYYNVYDTLPKDIVEHCEVKCAYPLLEKGEHWSFNHGTFMDYQTKYKKEFKQVKKEDYLSLCDDIGTRPTTGTIAIYDILRQNPQILYICGFSLYKSKTTKEYRRQDDLLDLIYEVKAHDLYKHFTWTKKIANHDKVEVDDYLQSVLNEFDPEKYTGMSPSEAFKYYLYN